MTEAFEKFVADLGWKVDEYTLDDASTVLRAFVKEVEKRYKRLLDTPDTVDDTLQDAYMEAVRDFGLDQEEP